MNQLKKILTYIEKQSIQAPKFVKASIFEKLKLVQNNPLSCQIDKLKEPSNKEFRAFIVFSYRITYQIKPHINEIRILRVRHTSREPLKY